MIKQLELRIVHLLFRFSSKETSPEKFFEKIMKLGVFLLNAEGACFYLPEKWTHHLEVCGRYKGTTDQSLGRHRTFLNRHSFSPNEKWVQKGRDLYIPLRVKEVVHSVLCFSDCNRQLDANGKRLLDRIVGCLNTLFANNKIQQDKDRYHNALVEISRVITQSENFDEVIVEAMELTSEVAGAHCAIMLLNKDGMSLHPLHGHNMDAKDAVKIPFPPPPGYDQTAFMAIMNRRESYVNDVLNNPLADKEFCLKYGFKSYLTIPLIIHDRPIGVIFADYMYDHEFTDYEINFFKEVGHQIGHVVYSLLTQRELLSAKNLQDRLNEMMREMATRTRLRDVLGDIVDNTHEILGNEIGVSVWLFNETADRIKLTACSNNMNMNRKRGAQFPLEELGSAGNVHDLLIEVEPQSVFGRFFKEHNADCSIGTPLMAGKDLMGILFLHAYQDHQWTEQEKLILTTIGVHAGPILRLAQYIQLLEMESKLDGLTKVYNRQYFEKMFREYSSKHIKHGKPFTIMMIDLDNFKQINDRYGHIVGDEVMRAVGSLMLETIRKTDKAFRYGGEEFVVLLPWTGKEEAIQVAERLRVNIENGDIDPPITVSIGLATYLEGTDDIHKVIEMADEALYKAKNTGKNCVICAEK